MSEISVAAQTLFHLGSIPITNTELAAFLVTAGLSVFAIVARRSMGVVPTKVQVALETMVDYIMTQLENAFGSKEEARKFFPLIMTTLLFLLVANQFSLVPLVTQIVAEGTPIFRVPTSHLALTLALALFMVVLANILAFKASPLGHIGSFIAIKPFKQARSVGEFFRALIEFFLGFLNIISEVAKVFSLSFRLFGNVFAGEVMVAVIAGLSAFTHFIVPMPFVVLSIFSGVIQAFVFTLLSIQYISSSIAAARGTAEA